MTLRSYIRILATGDHRDDREAGICDGARDAIESDASRYIPPSSTMRYSRYYNEGWLATRHFLKQRVKAHQT